MKAEDLRMKNLFTVNGNVLEVDTIEFGTVNCEYSEGGCEFHGYIPIGDIDESNHTHTPDRIAHPIPLTKDWLERFGFTYDNLGDDPPYEQWVLGDRQGFEIWDMNGDHWILTAADQAGIDQDHFKYVHQLQNLFHALTGEELVLKEEPTECKHVGETKYSQCTEYPRD